MLEKARLWITLIEVEGLEGNSDFEKGEKAFVNGIVLADSRSNAEGRFRETLDGLCFHIVSFEDTELWESRFKGREPGEALRGLARIARETGEAQFDTFHVWDEQG